MITKIHFIVNPVAGSGKSKLLNDLAHKMFSNGFYDLKIKESQYSGHAISLTEDSIAEQANIVVACGGDGTINEVAGCLVNTNIILGIIPMGSGNGLASNLKIPRNIQRALKIIKHFKVIEIDTGKINETFFFSNTGIGFDAHVIAEYENNKKRKLWGYMRSVIKTWRSYTYLNGVEVKFKNERRMVYPFLLFVSNSNEMGYKMSLTPKASLQDGFFDIIIVPKLSFLKMIFFTFLFFLKKLYWLKEVEFIKASSLVLTKKHQQLFKAQKDGESMEISEDIINIELFPKTLKVCVA